MIFPPYVIYGFVVIKHCFLIFNQLFISPQGAIINKRFQIRFKVRFDRFYTRFVFFEKNFYKK